MGTNFFAKPSDHVVEHSLNSSFVAALDESGIPHGSLHFDLPLFRKLARWHRIIANRNEETVVLKLELERQNVLLNAQPPLLLTRAKVPAYANLFQIDKRLVSQSGELRPRLGLPRVCVRYIHFVSRPPCPATRQ